MSGMDQLYLQAQTGYQRSQKAGSAAKSLDEKASEVSARETDGKKEVKGPGTYGSPKLSDKALDYYNALKKKYGNLNFVLVSSDKKQEAESRKGSFANAGALTVLIDTDKIEQMAQDEKYRRQIEGTIRNAASGIGQMAEKIGKTSSNVTAYGMTMDKSGTPSFFAVIDKSLAAQKKRLEKKAAQKKEAKRAEEKKEQRIREKERLEEKKKAGGIKKEDQVTITAGSMDELLQKIRDYEINLRSDFVETDDERARGRAVNYTI